MLNNFIFTNPNEKANNYQPNHRHIRFSSNDNRKLITYKNFGRNNIIPVKHLTNAMKNTNNNKSKTINALESFINEKQNEEKQFVRKKEFERGNTQEKLHRDKKELPITSQRIDYTSKLIADIKKHEMLLSNQTLLFRKKSDENYYQRFLYNLNKFNEKKIITNDSNDESKSKTKSKELSFERINKFSKTNFNQQKTENNFYRSAKTEEKQSKTIKETTSSKKNETSFNFIKKNNTNPSSIEKQNVSNKTFLKTSPTVYESSGYDKLLYEKYEMGDEIGKGSYAVVKLGFFHKKIFLGVNKFTKEKFAIKTYDKAKISTPQKQKNVQREILILTKLNHKNVIRLYESIDNDKYIHLVMEYVGHCSLLNFIKAQANKRIPELTARNIFLQLIQTVFYLHTMSIVHRDIKLENIIVFGREKIKLIDFGFSISVQRDKKLTIFCGTPTYMAPEIVSKQPYIGSPVDVWATGILLYAMLCGKFPFRSKEDKDLYKKINAGNFEIPNHVSDKPRKLIQKILNINPSERITIDEILKDEWFKEKK